MQPKPAASLPATKMATGNFLTEVEVAELLGVAAQTLSNWRWRGEGPRYLKIGRLVRYKPADVQAFLDHQAAVF